MQNIVNNDIEYVIYCRKSTEESTEKQTQSIPDQIRICMEYGKANGLIIKRRPKDFTIFESKEEKDKEMKNPILQDRQLYIDTEDLFIVREQKSAKTPGQRKKRSKVIKMIQQGKIKGLLSYSPDRQSRNLLEAGELIDLVDQKETEIDLKYTNFRFDPNASGKMMLGIWFVLSKQYSDKISEDVTRGKKTTVSERGKADGNPKHGYIINEEGYHQPHPKHFETIKEAFRLKLYENKSDEYIAKRLLTKGYSREYKTKRVNSTLKSTNIFRLRRDPFYYGLLVEGNNSSDLRESNDYYEPMITEEEYAIFVERSNKNNTAILPSKIKYEYEEEIMPFKRGMVKSDSGYTMTFNLPNRKRFVKILEKTKLKNKNAKLSDVIKINQIRYRDASKESPTKGLEITADLIDKKITTELKKIKIDEDAYNKYLDFAKTKFDENMSKRKKERKQFQLEYDVIQKKKHDYIRDNMQASTRGEEESNIYESEVKNYNEILLSIKNKINALEIKERNIILELESFIGLLSKAGHYYAKASFVQKRKICDLLFLNIFVNKKKQVALAVKPELGVLFNLNGGSSWTGTNDQSVMSRLL